MVRRPTVTISVPVNDNISKINSSKKDTGILLAFQNGHIDLQ